MASHGGKVPDIKCDDMNILNDSACLVTDGQLARTKAMRHVRPFYILPFLVHLALVFSASSLLSVIERRTLEDSLIPMTHWIVFMAFALTAPVSLAFSQIVPHPYVSLLLGGTITSSGLLWTAMATTPFSRLVVFGLLCGSGVSLSLQCVCVIISPYFIRLNISASACLLFVFTVMSVCVNPLMTCAAQDLQGHIFLYLSPVVLTSCLVPVLGHWLYDTTWTTNEEPPKYTSHMDMMPDVKCESSGGSVTKTSPSATGQMLLCSRVIVKVKSVLLGNNCQSCLVSGIIWLSWGAGVDTTWLPLGLRFHAIDPVVSLPCLQLTLCLVLLVTKLSYQYHSCHNRGYRLNMACNYLQLGLLGTAGVSLSLFPQSTHAFHNHLLFTLGFAMQYDDLSDLAQISVSRSLTSVTDGSVQKYHMVMDEEGWEQCGNREDRTSCVSVVCHVCHLMTLLLMSLIAMVMGIQVANLLSYISSLPPFSFIFQKVGLLVLSAVGVGVSLSRPDTWIKLDGTCPFVVT